MYTLSSFFGLLLSVFSDSVLSVESSLSSDAVDGSTYVAYVPVVVVSPTAFAASSIDAPFEIVCAKRSACCLKCAFSSSVYA